MRIAIDARSLEGNKTGVGRYLENILRVWAKRQDCEFILYFKDEIPRWNPLESANFTLKRIENPFGFSSNFFFQHFLLPSSLKQDRADFFFSPFYLRPLFCPVRSAIVLHDISYEAHPEWFDHKSQFVLKTLSRFSAGKADLIFTVSEYSKQEIIRYYGTPEDKIEVTPLAPDSNFRLEEDAEKIAEARRRYGLDHFILCVGTIFSRRHIPEIIEAFSRYAEKDQRYELMIVGKNKTYPFVDIDAMIGDADASLGAERIKRIDFASEEDLRALYSTADAVMYLSDYEGFGLPVVEAQSFGRPVITSRNTSLIEVGGDSVEFVRENSAEAILESLEKVLGDDSYRTSLIEAGKENLQRFDWKRCAGKTLERILKSD